MSSTREDQLLHKLKNCLGTHKNQGDNWQDLNTIKNTYCISKENPQGNPNHHYKNSQYQNYKSQYTTERTTYREPLGPSTYNHILPTHYLHHYDQKELIYQKDVARVSRSPQRDKPIKRYQYGLGLGLSLKNNKKLPSSQQSVTLSSNTNQPKKASKNYRQQVKQRQYYLQQQDQPPIKNIKPKYQYPFTPQTVIVNRQRMIPQQPQKIKRQEDKLKSKESKQCFALSKLNRIAELNEKINDRIRSIINVFEGPK